MWVLDHYLSTNSYMWPPKFTPCYLWKLLVQLITLLLADLHLNGQGSKEQGVNLLHFTLTLALRILMSIAGPTE